MYLEEMLRALSCIPFPRVKCIEEMSLDNSSTICGDSTDSMSDCDSVDFGTLFEARERTNPRHIHHLDRQGLTDDTNTAHDNMQECYFTKMSKQQASQSTYSNRTSRKKQKLEHFFDNLEPEESNSSSASSNFEDLEDTEKIDLHCSKHLYSGREVLKYWILLFVRILFQL
jgi:hypothetical protein